MQKPDGSNCIRHYQDVDTSGGPVVLAVDPSIVKSGVVVFQDKKIIATVLLKPTKDLGTDTESRMAFIAKGLMAAIQKYQPDTMFIETQYVRNNIGTALDLSKLRGFLQGFFYRSICNIPSVIGWPPFVNVSPLSAKSVMGVPTSFERDKSKEYVRRAVLKAYPFLRSETEDVIDAVSIGLAGYVIVEKKKKSVRPKTCFRSKV